ncbi:murein biosynthesis integral membrane protein MurJ [Winogradskyella sp.]|uniref:murein biosynthesis integral membrane protein MurJ n=1 Tax=Winogradskyella sp. TaxID=1883156 RepID=UPI002636C389|nr:lipid II flippase MurJ [Winogradskyella sp.]
MKTLLKILNEKLHNPVLRSMFIVGVITMLVKALAFYKETIVAGAFGLNEVIDTFIIASLIPTFVNSVFISSLTNLFIPNYIIELKNEGNKASFQSIVFIMVFLISLISAVVILISIDGILDIIYPNQPEENYQLVKDQLYVILPCLFLWGVSIVVSGLLEIENRFLISTAVGLIPLATMILFLFYLIDTLGEMVLAYGTLAGTILAFIYLLFFALKYKQISLGKPEFNRNSRQMLKQLPPKVSSGFLSVMNNFIDQFFAGQLVVGSLAALNYGNRIPAFFVAIVIMSLGNVLLPHFSRLVNDDLKGAYQYLFKILKWMFLAVLVFSIIAGIFSELIIELWLERDQFTSEDTAKVALIQQILLIHVPFYLCTLVLGKFLTSLNLNTFMAWISFFNLLINIILNVILIKYYGVYGLALSTTLVLIISSCFYFGYTYRNYKKIQT